MVRKIYDLLIENGVYCESVWRERDEYLDVYVYSVEIDGDWKHDHIYADMLIRENFFGTKVNERNIDDDDFDDCYTSIHYYILQEV